MVRCGPPLWSSRARLTTFLLCIVLLQMCIDLKFRLWAWLTPGPKLMCWLGKSSSGRRL